eukprot:1937002-Pyramimonas_sp.AAC.2
MASADWSGTKAHAASADWMSRGYGGCRIRGRSEYGSNGGNNGEGAMADSVYAIEVKDWRTEAICAAVLVTEGARHIRAPLNFK